VIEHRDYLSISAMLLELEHTLKNKPSIVVRWRRWERYVASMGEERNIYRLLVVKPEGKCPLEIPRHGLVDNIETDLGKTGWDDTNRIDLAQDRNQWRALVTL
jgi:hypothetical protein